jgi:hypothetical protein
MLSFLGYTIFQTDAAVVSFVNDTFVTHAAPLFHGLMAKFGPGTGVAVPDVVVCDYSSLGCSDFARFINATLILNMPDVNQAALDHTGVTLAPFLRSHEFFKSPAEVQARWDEHTSWTIAGLMSRLDRMAQQLVPRLFFPFYAHNWSYNGRPATLPPPASVLVDGRSLVLVNTFLGLEAPANHDADVVMTGPILSTALLARGSREEAGVEAAARMALDEPALSQWLLVSDQPVVYVSHGTLFPLADAARIVSLVRGIAAAGARTVFKTSLFDTTKRALINAGLLPEADVDTTSPSHSASVFVTKRCVVAPRLFSVVCSLQGAAVPLFTTCWRSSLLPVPIPYLAGSQAKWMCFPTRESHCS